VLEEMPRSKGAGAGDESDEAFESQYRQNVARELDQLRLFGITTERVSPRYGLSVAYITLSAARPTMAVRKGDSASDDDDDGEGPLSMPVDEALAGSERVLIRGEAGSGKTTLLQWLAVQSARDSFTGPLAEWNGMVPFFIQLRRWVAKGLPQPEHWLTHVASSIAGAMPNGWVHRQLQTGALVLIDGVDELPDAQRERVRDWLQGLIANAPGSRFIVSSRPAAAEEGWLRDEGFDDSQLQSMDREQIDALIDQWHAAARKQITDEEIVAELDRYQESLKRVVQSDRSIRNLATTPLLCAMLCLLNVDRRTKIPNDRMAVYRIALETLARREAERETDWANVLELTERQRELALEELAYWLVRNNNRSDATRREAEGVIADKLPQLAGQKARVVQYLLERSGLLREPVVDRIDFIHRTFQEYLAAKRLIASHDLGVLLSHAHEPPWREVVILATGHASDRCEEILSGLLQRADEEPEHRHYLSLLAVSCLETATAFSDETRRRIQHRLAELVPPKSITEANALASAAELAVPHLTGHRKRGARVVAACVRALSMIGGQAALSALQEYGRDTRMTVIDQLMRARDNFDIIEFSRLVLSDNKRITNMNVRAKSQLDGLKYIKSLRSLWIKGISEIIDLHEIAGLDSLQQIHIERCKGLTDLSYVADLKSLKDLYLWQCESITDLNTLLRSDSLSGLSLSGCRGIIDLTPLAGITTLQNLRLWNCESIADLTAISKLRSLKHLSLGSWTGMVDLAPLTELSGIVSLKLYYLQVNLKQVCEIRGVKELSLVRCKHLTDLGPLAHMPSLVGLDLSNSIDVKDLTPLAALTALQRLDLSGCPAITDLSPLASLHALQSLNLQGCTGVTDVSPLRGLAAIRAIRVSDEQLIVTAPTGLRPHLTTSWTAFHSLLGS
jgi:hypothetical protein